MNGGSETIRTDKKYEEAMPPTLLAGFIGFAVGFLSTALLIAVRFMASS